MGELPHRQNLLPLTKQYIVTNPSQSVQYVNICFKNYSNPILGDGSVDGDLTEYGDLDGDLISDGDLVPALEVIEVFRLLLCKKSLTIS